MLSIHDLHARVHGKPILQGLDLAINKGEIHVLMGPNGAGKSTLAKVLAGHPAYEITSGSVLFQNQPLLEMAPEERSAAGLFMSFQYPPEIPGVSNFEFLHYAFNAVRKARRQEAISPESFAELLDEKMRLVKVRPEFKDRHVNEGFSGGEKKKNEILQMAVLEPACAILDETDSGLDIDAMRVVAEGIRFLMSPEKSLLLITHYQRLLDYIRPDRVHVLVDGKVIMSGDADLAHALEEKGYDWLTTTQC